MPTLLNITKILWDEELFEKIEKKSLIEMCFMSDAIRILRFRMMFAGKVYGFETKLMEKDENEFYQINTNIECYLQNLLRLGFKKFIILSRKNYLRQIISGAIGFKRKQWTQQKDERHVLTKLVLDPKNVPYGKNYKPIFTRFEEFDRTYIALENKLKNEDTLTLSFEDDIADNPLKGYNRICRFLGIPAYDAKVKFKRMNPFPLSKIIGNYDDISAMLTGTHYEWMLND